MGPRVGPRVAPRVRPREPPREHPRGLISLFSALQGLPTKHPTKVSTEGPTSGRSGFTCPVFTCSVRVPPDVGLAPSTAGGPSPSIPPLGPLPTPDWAAPSRTPGALQKEPRRVGGRGRERAGREGLWLEGRVLQLQLGMGGGDPPNTSWGQTHIWGFPICFLTRKVKNFHPPLEFSEIWPPPPPPHPGLQALARVWICTLGDSHVSIPYSLEGGESMRRLGPERTVLSLPVVKRIFIFFGGSAPHVSKNKLSRSQNTNCVNLRYRRCTQGSTPKSSGIGDKRWVPDAHVH